VTESDSWPSGKARESEQPVVRTGTNGAAQTLSQAMQQADRLYSRGQRIQAEQCCKLILKADAGYVAALNLLGIIAAQSGRTEEASELLGRAVCASPTDPYVRNNYGNALKDLMRLEDALANFDCALELMPNFAEAHNNRGTTLFDLRRFDEALDSFGYALQIKPGFAEAWNNRGNVLRELKRYDEALDCFGHALQSAPNFAEVHNNVGATQLALRRFDDALTNLERAERLRPGYAEAINNRGVVLLSLGRYGDALACFERALALSPKFAAAWLNRADTLQSLERIDEALASFERALTIDQDLRWLYGSWLHAKMHLCSWIELDSQIATLVAKIEKGEPATPPFAVLALTESPAVQRQATEVWISENCPPGCALPSIAKRPRRNKIRLGYYSADFHNHATSYLAAGLFETHDRTNFEVIAFSIGPDVQDAMRQRLVAAFDRFVDVRKSSDEDIARISRDLEIDIAIDLKGLTQNQRLGIFRHRAAPIQVNFLGYPGTIAAPFIDYIIADRIVVPIDNRLHFSEQVAYLPNSYQVNDRKRQIKDRVFSRAELGLPETGFVFCCFNGVFKITPWVFNVWMRVLSQVPGSVLWLPQHSETATNNLRNEAEARGVSAARLIFAKPLPLAEHLARLATADLFMDTLPCNAHTTASDALWAGLPVLTCLGESFAGRVAASLLGAIGLQELITTTLDQYESLAIELACNPKRLSLVREKLYRNRLVTPLFDTVLFTRHIETAYTRMYEHYQLNLAPEHFFVAP